MKTYSFKNGVTVTLGPQTLSGFGENDAINLTPSEDIFKPKRGVDGQHTRSRTNNDDYECEITFMATSDARSKTQAMFLRNAALNQTVYPFTLSCPATGEYYFSAEAYLMRNPDADFGLEVGERKYKLVLPNCKVDPAEVITSLFGF